MNAVKKRYKRALGLVGLEKKPRLNEYVKETESVADRVQMSFNEDGTILSERKIYMAEKENLKAQFYLRGSK